MAGILDFLIDDNASTRTPPFLPSTDLDNMGGGGSPLEEELIQLLRKRRQPSLAGRLGNVVRGGVAAAAQPNRAYGGPMDMIAAFGGGLNNAHALDLQDEQLYNKRQDREVDLLGEIINNQRRGQVAQSQIAANRARQAAAEAAVTRAAKEKSTIVTGTGTVLERDATGKLVPVFTPPTKTPDLTEVQKNEARANQILNYADTLEAGGWDHDDALDQSLALFGRTPIKKKDPTPLLRSTVRGGIDVIKTNDDGTVTATTVRAPEAPKPTAAKPSKPVIVRGQDGEVIEVVGGPGNATARTIKPGTPKLGKGGKLAEIQAKLNSGTAPIIERSPSTGKMRRSLDNRKTWEYSSDGGKTWQAQAR